MDRLRSLEAFVRIIDEGGFAAAARSLRVSPAMVSKHVNALERRLGVRLLHRTTRCVVPTESGQAFYEEASNVLRDLDEAERVVSARSAQPRGLIRIAAPAAFSERYVAPLLPEFLRRHPQLELDLACDDKVIDLVQGRYDAALRIGRLPDSSLISRKLAAVEVLVCGAPSYLTMRGRPESLDELSGHVCLGYEYQWTGEGWAFQAGGTTADFVVKLPRPSYRSNNAEILRTLAVEGFGLVQLPTFIVGADIEAGRLVPVLTQFRPIERWVHFVYPSGKHLPISVRVFSDFLSSAFSTPPWGQNLNGADSGLPA